jgi:ketosteroid isomerase-like protein
MSIKANSQLVLEVFSVIERRDDQKFRDLLHPDFEIHWPPSLPYGRGDGGTWSETWELLQPTATEYKLDPRIIVTSEDEIVVLWRQRGVSPSGDRFDGEVPGLCQVREGKLARAQMFYFDTAAVANFIRKATGQSER